MKPTLNESEFAFFANNKGNILAALNLAVLSCQEKGYKATELKYKDLWSELYDSL